MLPLAQKTVRMSNHYRITLYIPSAEEKSEHHIEQAQTGFASIAGGANRQDITGAWVMKNGALCTEPVALVSSIVGQEALQTARAFALRYAQEIKASMSQETVLVTIDQVAEFLLV